MAPHIRRRDVLRGIGAAGIAGLAGCTQNGGTGTDGGSGSGPDALLVIGYPESGIQIFRDYYESYSTDRDIIVPDGMKDGSMPSEVGNDMANVTGTAPAAGGPNQEAFVSMFEDEYGESPGVFTAQSYDSVAIQLLANAAAGENSGPAIKEQMRRVANPGGTEVGPENLVEGIEAAASGDDVDYRGASSAVNFNEAGDPASAAYDIWTFDADNEATTIQDTQSFEGENPDGTGPSADSASGGMGRTLKVGILLPSSGDLASVGQPMTSAAELPVTQINDADVDLEVDAQIEDTQTSVEGGTSGAEALVNGGYPSVCGSASSGVNVPVSTEVFVPNEVVGCSPSSTALSVTNLDDNDYIFRTAPSDLLQGRVLAQVAGDRIGAGSVATMFVNNDYGQQLSERFVNVFEDQYDGSVSATVAFNKAESSYTSVLQEALGN